MVARRGVKTEGCIKKDWVSSRRVSMNAPTRALFSTWAGRQIKRQSNVNQTSIKRQSNVNQTSIKRQSNVNQTSIKRQSNVNQTSIKRQMDQITTTKKAGKAGGKPENRDQSVCASWRKTGRPSIVPAASARSPISQKQTGRFDGRDRACPN